MGCCHCCDTSARATGRARASQRGQPAAQYRPNDHHAGSVSKAGSRDDADSTATGATTATTVRYVESCGRNSAQKMILHYEKSQLFNSAMTLICTEILTVVFLQNLNFQTRQESEFWNREREREERGEARDDVKTGDNGMSPESTFSCLLFRNRIRLKGRIFLRRKLSPWLKLTLFCVGRSWFAHKKGIIP